MDLVLMMDWWKIDKVLKELKWVKTNNDNIEAKSFNFIIDLMYLDIENVNVLRRKHTIISYPSYHKSFSCCN